MAFKDKFDKLISYFDTDEVSDVEETVEEEAQRPHVQQQAEAVPQQAQRRAEPVQNVRTQQIQGGGAARQRPQQPQQRRAVEENQPVQNMLDKINLFYLYGLLSDEHYFDLLLGGEVDVY